MTKKPKPAGNTVEKLCARVEELRAWWENNVGPFDPEPDAREWPKWKLEVWRILLRHYEQDAVRAAEGSRAGSRNAVEVINQRKRDEAGELRRDVKAVRAEHNDWNVPRIAQWLLPRRPGDPLGGRARPGQAWRDRLRIKATADDYHARCVRAQAARIRRLDDAE